MQRARSRGFTLIEAMVAIAVLGILMVLAAPAMQKILAKQQLRSVVYDLIGDLTLARSEALKRSAPVELVPASGTQWHTGWRLRTPAGEVLSERKPFGGFVNLTNVPPGKVEFNASAQVEGGARVQFEFDDGFGNPRCVELDPVGRAKSMASRCPA